VLIDEVLARRRVETGVRVSIARLVHYVFIFIGFLLALLALGFEFTKLTIILSALGIGIGFGLQSIVNNLVSGLILLFERPVRVGDFIELGEKWAEIKKIGLRATTVQTFDQADVIIPNADLVANQVVNWTLSNRRVRLIVPVGVAYGSDVSLVMETLMASAKENSKIAVSPAPQVLFLNFGESALEFELRVWVLDADNRLVVSSELHQEIDRRFREAKIEISFPQQDLHLRSLDESVIWKHTET
jgi:potassium efflux system protein